MSMKKLARIGFGPGDDSQLGCLRQRGRRNGSTATADDDNHHHNDRRI